MFVPFSPMIDAGMSDTMDFNFRTVMDRIGISLGDPKRNQVVGRLLDRWASANGVPKQRPLTDKTSDTPSVDAPHCICAYPMEHFESAVAFIQMKVEHLDDPRQLQMELR